MSAMLRSPSSLVDACFFEACCDAAWTPCADHDNVAVKANEPCDYVAPIRGDRALFMSGKIEMEALEAASRVAIHAFFREYSKTKRTWEVDALIARYESRGVGPRRLLQLVENAFNRGRARRRRLLALRASGAAPRAASETLYLTNGGDASPRAAPAATVSYRGLFAGSPAASSPRTPPPPPGPDPSPAGSPATPRYVSPLPSPTKVPPPSPPAAARRRSTVKVGRTTVTLSPTAAASAPPAAAARKPKKRTKKARKPPRSAPGTGYALD